MLAEIRRLIAANPFVPFTIYTADGSALRVPTVDHIAIFPSGSRIFVFGDGEDYDALSPLLIARVNVDRGEPASPVNA